MATGINETRHLGNLTRDPELKYTSSGKAVARFTVACNYPFKDSKGEWQTGVDFITYIAWERIAEIAEKYLTKGSKVLVEGRVKPRTYEKDGSNVYVTDLVVKTLYMLDSRPQDESPTTKTPPKAADKNAPPKVSAPLDGPDITDEDIPF